MWCAAGELLKAEPLVPRSEDNWHELEERVSREKLVEAAPLVGGSAGADTAPRPQLATRQTPVRRLGARSTRSGPSCRELPR